MEMEMEVNEISAAERIAAVAERLEQALERMAGMELQAASLERVSAREAELEQQLAEAERTIAALQAAGTRRTVAAGSFAAKEGMAPEAGSLDNALGSLSVEQRIAVKAGLLRSGLLG